MLAKRRQKKNLKGVDETDLRFFGLQMRMTATTSLGLLQLNTDILRLSDWCHNMYLNTYCRFRLMIAQKFISC